MGRSNRHDRASSCAQRQSFVWNDTTRRGRGNPAAPELEYRAIAKTVEIASPCAPSTRRGTGDSATSSRCHGYKVFHCWRKAFFSSSLCAVRSSVESVCATPLAMAHRKTELSECVIAWAQPLSNLLWKSHRWCLATRVLRGSRLYPNPQQVSEASSLWPVGECSQGKSTDWIRTLGIWIGSALRQGLVNQPSSQGQGGRASQVVRQPVSRREDARTDRSGLLLGWSSCLLRMRTQNCYDQGESDCLIEP